MKEKIGKSLAGLLVFVGVVWLAPTLVLRLVGWFSVSPMSVTFVLTFLTLLLLSRGWKVGWRILAYIAVILLGFYSLDKQLALLGTAPLWAWVSKGFLTVLTFFLWPWPKRSKQLPTSKVPPRGQINDVLLGDVSQTIAVNGTGVTFSLHEFLRNLSNGLASQNLSDARGLLAAQNERFTTFVNAFVAAGMDETLAVRLAFQEVFGRPFPGNVAGAEAVSPAESTSATAPEDVIKPDISIF